MSTEERLGILGVALSIGLLAIFIFWGPRFSPYSPKAMDVYYFGGGAPTGTHWCGVDELGRDICSEVLAGASLQARRTGTALAMAAVLGLMLGIVAGSAPTRPRAIILACAHAMRDIPPLVVPGFCLGLTLFPATFFSASDWQEVTVAVLLVWPSYTLLACVVVQERRKRVAIPWRRTLGASGLRVLIDASSVVMIIAWLDLAGLGPSKPSSAWGTMLNSAFQDPVPWRSSLQWWSFIFPVAAIGATVAVLRMSAWTVREITLAHTANPAWWDRIRIDDIPGLWLVGYPLETEQTTGCPNCGNENAVSRQFCGNCDLALVAAPVEAGKHTRPLWAIVLFMVISLGLYNIPWCFRACRFVNAVWASSGSSRRRSPWIWCPLALIPLLNSIAIYRLAADIRDATKIAGPPSSGTLGLAYLLSYLALAATEFPPFSAFTSLVGLLARIGCVLSMQQRINLYFEQDNPEVMHDWEPGWLGPIGFIVGIGAWATLILYLTQ